MQFGGLASQNRGGVSSYYGYDALGSVRILVSTAGAVTDEYSNTAFGEPIQPGSGTPNPHVYVGLMRYRLQSDGSYLLSVRLLDPVTGRFTSVDPVGPFAPTDAAYGYAGNCPTVFVDPSGLQRSPAIQKPGRAPWYRDFSECVDRLQKSGRGRHDACVACKMAHSDQGDWQWPDCGNKSAYPVQLDIRFCTPGWLCIAWACTGEVEKSMYGDVKGVPEIDREGIEKLIKRILDKDSPGKDIQKCFDEGLKRSNREYRICEWLFYMPDGWGSCGKVTDSQPECNKCCERMYPDDDHARGMCNKPCDMKSN